MSLERENETTQPSSPIEDIGVEVENSELAAESPETTPLEAAAETPASTEPQYPESAAADHAESAEVSADSSESLDALLDQYSAPHQAPTEGEILEGHVVAITDLGVVVDIGSKSEALIPAQELLDADAGPTLMPGQTVEVERLDERKEGYVLLSYLRARRRRAWERIEQSHRNHTPLVGRVVDRIKGGMVVDVGIRAFLPASQADIRPVQNMEEWKDREIECRVLKVNRKRGNVVVSRRVLLEEQLQEQRQKLMEQLVEGAVVRGTVKSIAEYGAFIELGGLDGLLHVTDISWGRVANPAEVLSVGQEIECKVLKFDREKMRISLGHKQLRPDPWANVPDRIKQGARMLARIVGVTDYGAFAEVEPGIEGLIHVSEMTWSKRMKHPSKIVALGDEVEVVVLDVKPDQRRISLGMKQTLPNPWQSLSQRYPVGTVVSGRVRNLTEFGAFVEVEDGIDGLIHVSDISWTQKVKSPAEVLKKGETVQAKVLKIDTMNRRLSLGIKQVNDIWADWFEKHKVGHIVRGRVARSTNFGVFVELGEGIEGLCHISEIEERHKGEKGDRGEKSDKDKKARANPLEVGQEYDFKIVKLDPNQHRIGLSYRAAQRQSERREIEQYRSSRGSGRATIGDAILSKRGQL
jgi:small subunit ribosomal protein S1